MKSKVDIPLLVALVLMFGCVTALALAHPDQVLPALIPAIVAMFAAMRGKLIESNNDEK